MEDLDITTQYFLGEPGSHKVKVWFAVEADDSYSVGLGVRHNRKYTTLNKSEAIEIAKILTDYASKVDDFNKDNDL